jgi:DNA-binding transcriptional LysR family regulator
MRSVEVRGPLRANNGELIRDAAMTGLGIARLPDFIVASALKSGQLVAVLEAFQPTPLSVFAVYPQHRQSSVTIRAFVEYLREALRRKWAA